MDSDSVIQRQRVVNEPSDRYEQEADRVSAQVLHQLSSRSPVQRPSISPVPPTSSQDHALQPELVQIVQNQDNGGKSLTNSIRRPLEQAFGADFSQVRIHEDSGANRLNQALQAKALTVGQDIYFRSGYYEPQSRRGQALLAHELTHVMQQGAAAHQHFDGYSSINRPHGSAPPLHLQRQSTGIASRGPRRLERQDVRITTIEGPTLHAHGNFQWRVAFSLPNRAAGDGFIIQEVRMIVGDPDTNSETVANHYWETWEVRAGQRIPYDRLHPYDDTYTYGAGGAAPAEYGRYIMRGIARFYEGPLPSAFGPYRPDHATFLSMTEPLGWTGEGTQHDVTSEWETRPGRPHYNRLFAVADGRIFRIGS